ncbi:MAG: hypothetical protein KGZ65_02600 [Sphingomonadales bacterium]|nr:hypothetical protein [Sphingomonadaceae bacterium]MBS3930095.1 hypothetical protein [Sphingomonadales bacterium]
MLRMLEQKQQSEASATPQDANDDIQAQSMALAKTAESPGMRMMRENHNRITLGVLGEDLRRKYGMGPFSKRASESDSFSDMNEDDTLGSPKAMSKGWQWRYMNKDVDEGLSQWLPRLFKSQHTPVSELLASPGKQGLLGGLGGLALGGAGGALGAQHLGANPVLGGLGGAGLGAILGGLSGYGSRRKKNDKLIDAMRFMPPGATLGEMDQLEAAKKAPKPDPIAGSAVQKLAFEKFAQALKQSMEVEQAVPLGLAGVGAGVGMFAGGAQGRDLAQRNMQAQLPGQIEAARLQHRNSMNQGLDKMYGRGLDNWAKRRAGILQERMAIGPDGNFKVPRPAGNEGWERMRDQHGQLAASGPQLRQGFNPQQAAAAKQKFLASGQAQQFIQQQRGAWQNQLGRMQSQAPGQVAAAGRRGMLRGGLAGGLGGLAVASAPMLMGMFGGKQAEDGSIYLEKQAKEVTYTDPKTGKQVTTDHEALGKKCAEMLYKTVDDGDTQLIHAAMLDHLLRLNKRSADAERDTNCPLCGMLHEFGLACSTKKAEQEDTSLKSPNRSASGESKGLTFAHRADDHATGPAAWQSIDRFLSKDVTVKTDPYKGKHGGTKKDTVNYKLAALSGVESGLLGLKGRLMQPGGWLDELMDAQRSPVQAGGSTFGTLPKLKPPDLKGLLGKLTGAAPAAPTDAPADAHLAPLPVALAGAGIGLGGAGLGYGLGKLMGKKKEEPEKSGADALRELSLSPAAVGFFDYCDRLGLDATQVKQAVDVACAKFPEAEGELRHGLAKRAQAQVPFCLEKQANKLRGMLNAGKSAWGWMRGAKPVMAQGLQTAPVTRATASPLVQQAAQLRQATPGLGVQQAMAQARSQQPGMQGVFNNYMRGATPYSVASSVGQTAMGGLGGAFAGEELGLPGGGWTGAAAGALAMNPMARRFMARNPRSLAQPFMRGGQGAIGGGFAGSAIDQTAGALGYDTNGRFAQAGAGFGLLAGGGRGLAAMRVARHGAFLPGVMAQASKMSGPARADFLAKNMSMAGQVNSLGAKATQGLEQFARGSMAPLTGVGKTGWNLMTGAKNPFSSAWKGAVPGTRLGRIGATVGGVGMGATALGMGSEYLHNRFSNAVDEKLGDVYNQAMPQFQDDAAGFLDQYMQSRGLMNEQGQFDPMQTVNRNGGIMGSMMQGSDKIFQGLGMDPSRMSPMQKMMIMGGALGLGGGAMGGSPGVAGAGGLAMMGGLLPTLMQGQGQGGQRYSGYNPMQQQSAPGYEGQAPGQNPNSPQARNEWLHQQQLQQGG